MSEYDVGPDDGPALEAVTAGSCKLLVVRDGGGIFALSATCPHAGADLSEAVLLDGQLVCPWHKAAFDVATGACLAPPAVDPLQRFDVRVAQGRLLVRLPARPPQEKTSPPHADIGGGVDTRCMAVIGTGAAGEMAVQTLRQEGFAGRIVLIGPEPDLPYDRTKLSKSVLAGTPSGEKSPLQSAFFFNRHRIERRTASVTAIDPQARCISLDDGGTLHYHAALLATGGIAKRPTLDNGALAGVFTLRSAQDAAGILRAAEGVRACVVLGGGFIGMEAAAALRERGLEVTVVVKEALPLADRLGMPVARALAGLHEEHGVVLRTGRTAVALLGQDRVQGVRLDDGQEIAAGLVVAGYGITPATAMLPAVLRDADGAVDVDATLRVADGLYAAGDIARFSLHGRGTKARVEHWRLAQQQGAIAARNMLGQGAHFTATPYFWTIQYRQRLDYAGHAQHWDELVVDGDPARQDFIAYYLRHGQVDAVAAMKHDEAIARVIAAFDLRHDWTLSDLRRDLGPLAELD